MEKQIISILPTLLIIKDGHKYIVSINWLGVHLDFNFHVT